MPFQKGNKLGGRKTLDKEIEMKKETMKKQTIEELATDKVYKQLTTLRGRDTKDRQGIKEIALPVYLKSKADLKTHKVKIEQITGAEITKDET